MSVNWTTKSELRKTQDKQTEQIEPLSIFFGKTQNGF